jgi:transposase InsO family protein
MRYAFIDEHRSVWPLPVMCRILEVSKSGYFAWKNRPDSAKETSDRVLAEKIATIHSEHRSVYGSPRIHQVLKQNGFHVSRKRVARLMKESGISAKRSRRRVITTDSKHDLPIAENLLERDFGAEAPDKKWATDITYIETGEGFLYLAAIEDLWSRRIVGWAMDATMDRSLVLSALEMALGRRNPEPGMIHHSDRGSQYASKDYRQMLVDQGIQVSMSRRGDCYDNAMIESFWHTLKNELVYRTNFKTHQEAKDAIFEYIEVFYNRKRRHSSIGYQSPESFEKEFSKKDAA